jgi:uroporphyrinogen III methyltransferase/synthase
MSLKGRTIVTTRGASQSAELRTMLEELGARVIECPMIEIQELSDWSEVDAAVRRLDEYQWLVFTSTNAVESFFTRMKAAGIDCSVPVAAVGSATAAKLREWNVVPRIVPRDFRAEGLLDAFPRDLSGLRILIPRAETARELLPTELRSRGAQVDVLTVYRTVRSQATAAAIFEIFDAHHIDCIVFTSSSTVRHLAKAVGQRLPSLLCRTAVAVIGPITGDTAREAGLSPAIEPGQSTITALVHAISRHPFSV